MTRGRQVRPGRRSGASLGESQGAAPLPLGHGFEELSGTPDAATRKQIARKMRQERVSPDFIYAFEKTGLLVTDGNQDLWPARSLGRWKRALRDYQRIVDADTTAIDFCFPLHHEFGHSEVIRKKRLAASEFAIAALCAHDQGLSSFAVERLFREAWLDFLLRPVRVASKSDADPAAHSRHDNVDLDRIRQLLDMIHGDLNDRVWSDAIQKRIAKIETARAAPGTWLGRPPDLPGEEEAEEILTIDDLQNAITHCELDGVPQDLIESMLLRSWVRMRVLNERADERFFQVLDKHWDDVHARVQMHVAEYSGLRLQ
ncbi:MAG TPA: hypothetical protein VGR47_02645 [Terracidiphilus sp.]|nr:hypothetical protein [Terracidiphilus sp.]